MRSSDGFYFTFPKGVDWSNATPGQVADATVAAVKANPSKAADIAASALQEAMASGRFTPITGVDTKQSIDPEPTFWSFRWLFPRKEAASR